MMRHQVMVVEDDADIRETLVEILQDFGVEAVQACNGREALDQLCAGGRKPCLILLDLMMPVMDGRAFREAQLQSPELDGIPVVVLSAYRDANAMAEGLQVTNVIKKPLKLAEIRASVEKYCGALA